MRMRSTSPRKPSDLASGLPYVVRSSLGLPWVPLALGTASAASQLYQDPVIFCFVVGFITIALSISSYKVAFGPFLLWTVSS